MNRNRKESYIGGIKKSWGEPLQDWNFAALGENHLAAMNKVAKRFSYSDADSKDYGRKD